MRYLKNKGRYTLSMHKKPQERAHLDLFLDLGHEKLAHYYLPMEKRQKNNAIQTFFMGKPHRRIYLVKEGFLGSLGKLKIISRGFFEVKKEFAQKGQIKVKIHKKGQVDGVSQ